MSSRPSERKIIGEFYNKINDERKKKETHFFKNNSRKSSVVTRGNFDLAPLELPHSVEFTTSHVPVKALLLLWMLQTVQSVASRSPAPEEAGSEMQSMLPSSKTAPIAELNPLVQVQIKASIENTIVASSKKIFAIDDSILFVTKNNLKVTPALFHHLQAVAPDQIKILKKQMAWIKDIFDNEMQNYFDKQALKLIFDDGFVIYIEEKNQLIKEVFSKATGIAFDSIASIGYTSADGTTITFSPTIDKISLQHILVNEVHHLINLSVFKRLAPNSSKILENWPYPFVDTDGQIDSSLFKLFKSGIEKGEKRIGRILELLEKDESGLEIDDLKFKSRLVALAHQYQPFLFSNFLTDKQFEHLKRKYPTLSIFQAFKTDNHYTIQFYTISPGDQEPLNKLRAVVNDLALMREMFKEEDLEFYNTQTMEYSYNHYIYYKEYASNIDMLFQNNALKKFLWSEYSEYMESYYKSGYLADKDLKIKI